MRKIAAILWAAALTVGLTLPAFAAPVSNPNEVEYWLAQYPNAVACYKYDKNTSNAHGTAGSKIVVLNPFQPQWPGDRWEVLIVKGGSAGPNGDGNAVYPLPVAGVQYTAPPNNGGQVPNISHWIVCKGQTPEETTTTSEATTTTVEETTTTVPETTSTTVEETTTTTVIETTTTVPEETTSTTEPTTTTTEQETTTTTEPSTTTTEATTTTVAESTTTTVPSTTSTAPSTTSTTIEQTTTTQATTSTTRPEELPFTGMETSRVLMIGAGLVVVGYLITRYAGYGRSKGGRW